MKSILLILVLVISTFTSNAQQNIVKNNGFEDPISGYTASTNKGNDLFRIATERKSVIEVIQPTTEEKSVVDGCWYKLGNASGYNKCLVETENNNSFLKIIVPYNSSLATTTALQRIGKLDVNKKYKLSFKARLENTYNTKRKNQLEKVEVSFIDLENKPKKNKVEAEDLKYTYSFELNENWTEYSKEIDFKEWKELLKGKVNLSGNSIAITFNVTADKKNENDKYLQYGVDIDDIELIEL